MHTITVNIHGCKAGTPPPPSDHLRTKRKAVSGWSKSASRRNIDFLCSVPYAKLDGLGYNFTGTIKDCPDTPDDWKKIREAFFVRLRRMGLIRLHWVTEWQRRGVPHIHCAIWFPDNLCTIEVRQSIKEHWLAVTAEYRSQYRSQDCGIVYDSVGWIKYVSKHTARGASHYQRSPESIPSEWLKKTGRVWGKIGQWETKQAVKFRVPSVFYYRFRRVIRNWRIADARRSNDKKRIKQARTMYQFDIANKGLCSVMGLAEFVPAENIVRYIEFYEKNRCPEEEQIELITE